MACCNLADSFENSASVTVGYSDAVTGARQIRILGLSGVYTQMLDENRPAMRGIAAPFELSYVPGQWLESIQVSKGLSTVVNGVESITGQINRVSQTYGRKASFCESVRDERYQDRRQHRIFSSDGRQLEHGHTRTHIGKFKDLRPQPRQLQG